VNEHDHAVVIGISRYADAADPAGWVSNLQGPDNDAAAIADWLRDPDGGALPDANVRVVRSADLPDPFGPEGPAPAQQAVVDALDSVAALPTTAYEGRYAGRRFYLYVAGHGWASRRNEAALVTAEATRKAPQNALASDWMEWLWYADRFRELVLWVDACATRTPVDLLHGCGLPATFAAAPGAQRFDAFAARFNLKSVENEMPDGAWHGAFTYALLQGLRGAAPGAVTAASLRDYLINAMKAFMRDDQHVATVAQEPDFGRVDGIEFASAEHAPTFPVTLRFRADCVGHAATVSTRSSLPPAAQTVLDGPTWTPELAAGSYAAFVPDLQLVSAFTVTGGGVDGDVAVP
jgi:hypothetical protein